jgi:rubrerythrin
MESLIDEMDRIIGEAIGKKPPKIKSIDLALNILDLAIRIEGLTRGHYSEIAKKVTNPRGRDMFKYLADEEKEHIRVLRLQHDALRKDGKWLLKEGVTPRGKICPIVIPKKRDIKAAKDILPEESEVKKDATDLDALKLAMEVKKRLVVFYCTAAAKIDDPDGKKMFSHLVELEDRHLNELKVQYAWLDQAGFWYDHSMMTD